MHFGPPQPLHSHLMMMGAGRSNGGSSGGLSNDTSLQTYTIDSEDVLLLNNIERGNGVTEVPVTAVPTHPGATRTINGAADADPVMINLSTGDNVVTVTVTAEDGVTTQDHVVTVRRLTAGVQEITLANFIGIGGSSFASGTGGEGFIISKASGRLGFWAQTGTETQPDWSSFGVTNYVEILMDSLFDLNTVVSVFETALTSNGFSVSNNNSGILTITDPTPGARVDAEFSTALSNGSAGSCFVNVTQQGVNPS